MDLFRNLTLAADNFAMVISMRKKTSISKERTQRYLYFELYMKSTQYSVQKLLSSKVVTIFFTPFKKWCNTTKSEAFFSADNQQLTGIYTISVVQLAVQKVFFFIVC